MQLFPLFIHWINPTQVRFQIFEILILYLKKPGEGGNFTMFMVCYIFLIFKHFKVFYLLYIKYKSLRPEFQPLTPTHDRSSFSVFSISLSSLHIIILYYFSLFDWL